MTPFSKIFDKFMLLIKDEELLDYLPEDVNFMLISWLENACVTFKKCKTAMDNINIQTSQFDKKLNLEEEKILAYSMVLEWIQPEILHQEKLKQKLGDKDYKTFSPANLLDKLMELESKYTIKVKNMITSYTYNDL